LAVSHCCSRLFSVPSARRASTAWLTQAVSQAVDALRADGTLKRLEQQWLTASAGAPVLK
ncbi:MAG TPA: hypothetical protein VHN80_01045, partial [Kineosporiaceae bacterium]|nr:hypothetical protein [Kineosporiaceae bacterium]